MRHPRLILTIAGLVAVLGAVPIATAIGDDGDSDNPGGGGNVFAAAALGDAITYQGRLLKDGNPEQGFFDFRFILYDAAEGGNQKGSTVPRDNVLVQAGLFTVLLDFGAPDFSGEGRWLEIRMRPAGSPGDYTTLSPRQAITATPYALFAKKAGIASALALPFSAIGSSATEVFAVRNTDNVAEGSAAITGRTDSTKDKAAGVQGIVTQDAMGAFSSGVTGINNGSGENGIGVSGYQDGSGWGVYGVTPGGVGVRGESATGTGVQGLTTGGTGGAFRGDVSVQLDGAIKVLGAKAPGFIHTVAVGDGCVGIAAHATAINNPLTDGNPNAILLVTVNKGLEGGLGHPTGVGVFYDVDDFCAAADRWLIYSLDGVTPMTVGEKFNVLVLTQ